MSEWDYEAQRAAERRLYVADDLLWSDEQGLEGPDEDDETVGAYCGCYTCMVREALDAAWPYLYRLAHEPDTPVPTLPERDSNDGL
jgi:hypothetical protein